MLAAERFGKTSTLTGRPRACSSGMRSPNIFRRGIGEQENFLQLRYLFFPSDGIELYRMLDWVRRIER
jgi:hypothetical protein